LARLSVELGHVSQLSAPNGTFQRAPMSRTICSAAKPVGSFGLHPSAAVIFLSRMESVFSPITRTMPRSNSSCVSVDPGPRPAPIQPPATA
jgi:hypothetical protein